MKKILIIGAGGQIGSELTMRLRSVYGNENVVATDMRDCPMLAANGLGEAVVSETGGGIAIAIPAARSKVLLPMLADLEMAGARFTALDLRAQDDQTLAATIGATP